MNSSSSAFRATGSFFGEAAAIISWYQWSRPSVQAISFLQRLTTTTFSMEGQVSTAVSALAFRGKTVPRR